MRPPTTGAEHGSRDLPERTLGGYVLLSQLGQGSNATVYLARKAGIERLFALKVLPSDRDQEALSRFRREAQVAARLDHPGLVPVVDVGEDRGRSFLVMEHIPGKSLKEVLRQRGRLPWKEAGELVAGLAEALGVAHAAGVVHRDLKPANILIDERDGVGKVTDFGLARDTSRPSELTRTGDLIGTPYYMAPEQVRGQRTDERTDVYGLGVILYEAITGVRPYAARALDELVAQILAGRIETPRRLVPDLDPSLEGVCLRAMSQRPRDRFESASEFAGALRDALAGVSGTRLARASGVQRVSLALGVGAVGLFLVLLLWGAYERSRVRFERAQREADVARLETRLEGEARRTRDLQEERDVLQRRLSVAEAHSGAGSEEAVQARSELLDARRELLRLERAGVQPRGFLAASVDGLIERLRSLPGTDLLRSRLLFHRGRRPEALEALQAAREQRPDDLDVDIYEFFLRQGLPGDEASRALQRLADRAPPESVQGIVAKALLAGQRSPQWHEALLRASALAPDKAWVWVLLCKSHNDRGLQGAGRGQRGANTTEFHAGILAGDRAIALEPTDPMAHYSRSACLYHLWLESRELELQERILADLLWAREVLPEPSFWTDSGKSLVLFGRVREAVPQLLEAVRRADGARTANEGARARAWLGAARLEQGEEDQARELWLEGIRLAPTGRSTYEFAGHLQRTSAATQRAILDAAPEQVRRQLEPALRRSGR